MKRIVKLIVKLMLYAFMAPLAAAPSTAQPEHKSALELLKDFVNLTKKTDQSFEYWIEQLRFHITHKDKFVSFEKQLRSGLQANKPQSILKAFNDHKMLFGNTAQTELLKLGLPKLQAAFKERLALHQRLTTAQRKATKQHAERRKQLLGLLLITRLNRLSDYTHTEDRLKEEKMRYQKLLAWLKTHQ